MCPVNRNLGVKRRESGDSRDRQARGLVGKGVPFSFLGQSARSAECRGKDWGPGGGGEGGGGRRGRSGKGG